jgi:hypothetical protein
MAVRPTDPEALHLYQLLGAPLLAVIQAEAQAAQVSAEYIKRIGFVSPTTTDAKAALLQDGGSLGDLKVAEFRIDRPDASGNTIPYTVKMPVLSLFPIPLLQVKEADIDFDVRILSRVPLADDQKDQGEPAFAPPDFLAGDRVELKGFLASSPGVQAANQAHLKMRVRLAQSDMPAGLMHLMAIMRESVQAAPAALLEQPKSNGRDGSEPPATKENRHD